MFAARPGTRDSGVLSVAAQNYYDVKVQQILKPGAFRPSPKVDSAVRVARLEDPPAASSSTDCSSHLESVWVPSTARSINEPSAAGRPVTDAASTTNGIAGTGLGRDVRVGWLRFLQALRRA